MADLQPEKNEESCFVSAEDDDGIDRLWWSADACPAKESCTRQGWKRAACWSYESEAQVQKYVLKHLMDSGLHAMEEETAQVLAASTDISQNVESSRERSQYRKQCEQFSEPKKRSRSPKARGKGKHKNKGHGSSNMNSSMSELNENVKALAAALTGQAGQTRQSGGMPSSSKAQPVDIISLRQAAAAAPVAGSGAGSASGAQISRRDLLMLQSSLSRAVFSAASGHSLLTQLGQQFQTESAVLSHAKSVVDDILANSSV